MSAVSLDELVGALSLDQAERLDQAIRHRWRAWARPKQLPPADGDWDILGLVAGKGGGKTRPGAEHIRSLAENNPGIRLALVGRTMRDARNTMVLGKSGILAIAPPWFRPVFTKDTVRWPNKAQASLYSADKPAQLRGPEHHGGWGDEFSHWQRPEALTNLLDGLRLGNRPQLVLTTTPQRNDLTRDTFLGPKGRDGRRTIDRERDREALARGVWEFVAKFRDPRTGVDVLLKTVVRRWSTEENNLNLPPGYAAKRRAHYAGSSLGRQELDADLLEDVDGALWTLAQLDALRAREHPRLVRIIVAVDPSHADDGGGDACGIVVLGLGDDGHCYVLADYTLNASPNAWGKEIVRAYNTHTANLVVFEDNDSPDNPRKVRDVIKVVDPKRQIKWHAIHASKDKRKRAEPVAAMYGDPQVEPAINARSARVHHVAPEGPENHLALLEDEMVTWEPTNPRSPNRLDALVHGVSYLMLSAPAGLVAPESGSRASTWRV